MIKNLALNVVINRRNPNAGLNTRKKGGIEKVYVQVHSGWRWMRGDEVQ